MEYTLIFFLHTSMHVKKIWWSNICNQHFQLLLMTFSLEPPNSSFSLLTEYMGYSCKTITTPCPAAHHNYHLYLCLSSYYATPHHLGYDLAFSCHYYTVQWTYSNIFRKGNMWICFSAFVPHLAFYTPDSCILLQMMGSYSLIDK